MNFWYISQPNDISSNFLCVTDWFTSVFLLRILLTSICNMQIRDKNWTDGCISELVSWFRKDLSTFESNKKHVVDRSNESKLFNSLIWFVCSPHSDCYIKRCCNSNLESYLQYLILMYYFSEHPYQLYLLKDNPF